jgi:Uma2 family endonuclease
VDAGVFDEPKRLELIKGDLWEKEPLNPPHASGIRRISRLLRRLLEPEFLVDEEKLLHLANDAEPVPDIYVAVGGADDYEERHPTQSDIRLLIEVADTTVDRDTGEKALLYAQAGIEDYWVYVVQTNDLIVFRTPTLEGYRNRTRLTATDIVTPLAIPDINIPVSDLLPRVSQSPLVQEG